MKHKTCCRSLLCHSSHLFPHTHLQVASSPHYCICCYVLQDGCACHCLCDAFHVAFAFKFRPTHFLSLPPLPLCLFPAHPFAYDQYSRLSCSVDQYCWNHLFLQINFFFGLFSVDLWLECEFTYASFPFPIHAALNIVIASI